MRYRNNYLCRTPGCGRGWAASREHRDEADDCPSCRRLAPPLSHRLQYDDGDPVRLLETDPDLLLEDVLVGDEGVVLKCRERMLDSVVWFEEVDGRREGVVAEVPWSLLEPSRRAVPECCLEEMAGGNPPCCLDEDDPVMGTSTACVITDVGESDGEIHAVLNCRPDATMADVAEALRAAGSRDAVTAILRIRAEGLSLATVEASFPDPDLPAHRRNDG